MSLEAGKMDRLIRIEQPVSTQGALGGQVITWKPFRRWWAEFVPQRVTERLNAAQVQASEVAIFRGQWDHRVNSEMRMIHRNRIFRIVGIVETETGVSMEITGEYLQDNDGR